MKKRVAQVKQLMEYYQTKKNEIRKRLRVFEDALNQPDEKVFAELCFCICTPQSKATLCDEAITALERRNLLLKGNADQIRQSLRGVRFAGCKARYIVEARELFERDGKIRIKERLASFDDIHKLREWMAENVKGMGLKESSHFLRNVGLGKNLAILDRHILKNLKEFGIIGEVKNLTEKRYLSIESKMRTFAEGLNIPIEELDLLLWSRETGIVFK
jgi:N-glycosylase/DNA lyase